MTAKQSAPSVLGLQLSEEANLDDGALETN